MGAFPRQKKDVEQFNPKEDAVWEFGPDLPEPFCCASPVQGDQDLLLNGGATPNEGFLVMLLHPSENSCIMIR